MNHAEPVPPVSRRWPRFALPVLLWGAVAGGVLYAVLASEGPPPDLVELDLTGVTNPHAVPAAQSILPDQAPVIGVTVNGKHRAYSVTILSDVDRHVVNDRLGDTPLAVTYCDRSDCARAFVGELGGPSMHVGIGGYLGTPAAGTLLLKLAGIRYRQDNGQAVGAGGDPLPLREGELTRTTWQHWREMYPDTDVYDGAEDGRRHETR